MTQRGLTIVLPMAGRGSRFTEAGYRDPKPLIEVRGKPMYAWAMDSLPLSLASRLVLVCLAEHLENRRLRDDILRRYRALKPEIIGLDHVTQGQACTVLTAEAFIDNDDGLMIYNADTFMRTRLDTTLPSLVARGAAGVLSVFDAPGDKWSFARTDAEGRVLETAEKKRISPWATTGLYHFTRGRDFVRHSKQMIADNDRSKGEFYVAPIYNRMIAEGSDIRVDPAVEVWVLGTPEDLDHFQRNYPS